MALKSSREGLRKELVDYLGNIIVDDNLRNEIVKAVGDKFVTPELLNENVNNLTMQITTESGERTEADNTLQNNITAETTAREGADTTLQNNINTETIARQEAIANLEELIVTSGLHVDLLWTNASPTSNFASQTISFSIKDYKLLLLIFKRDVTSTFYISELIKNLVSTWIVTSYDGSIGLVTTRNLTIIDDSNISFADGNKQVGFGADNTDNSILIPYYIYGVR